jgi:hypothetical protein
MELILLGLVASIGFASYALWSRARGNELRGAQKPVAELESGERTPTTLQINDVVQHLGTDWIVEGILSLSEDGRNTRLYALTDGSEARFLFASAAEPDPVLLRAAPELRIEGTPDTLTAEGHAFALKVRGTVAAKRLGAILPSRRGDNRVTFGDYASGTSRLLVLQWGSEIDAFVGERVPLHLLELLPAR